MSIALSAYWDANRRQSSEEASVSDPETFRHFEFVGLGPPAEGWRAIYRDEDYGTVFVQPLVTWALFHFTLRDECGEVVEDWGNVMEGVVWDRSPFGSVFDCAPGRPTSSTTSSPGRRRRCRPSQNPLLGGRAAPACVGDRWPARAPRPDPPETPLTRSTAGCQHRASP